MMEPSASLLSLLYKIGSDVISKLLGKKRRLTNAQIIDLRQKWKPKFEEEILRTRSKKFRQDVVIRDISRQDLYPNLEDSGKGISPWFRVGLVDTYHRGILVGLGFYGLKKTKDGNGWRYPEKSEDSEETFVLIGKIPFENIENVNWSGDEYYSFPHIYCWFSSKSKEPYEEVVFCRKGDNNGFPFYTDVVRHSELIPST